MNSNLAQVPDQQRIPLETAIGASTPGQSALVAKLYAAALSSALEERKITDEPGVLKHRHAMRLNPESRTWSVVTTATEEATGLFVTLSGIVDLESDRPWKEGPFLIFGKKFLQELKPPQLHNTAVKIWR